MSLAVIEGGENGSKNLPQPRVTPHLILVQIQSGGGCASASGTSGVRLKHLRVKVRCGCQVCVRGCDNVAIFSVNCMCASLLRLHNRLPAGTCGSSSQGTKLLYFQHPTPTHEPKSWHTNTHTTACKLHESFASKKKVFLLC